MRRPWSTLARPRATQAVEAEGIAALRALKAEGERRQLEALLSGEADANDSYVEVHSGAGGTESWTGRACCCECTRAGRSGESSKSS